MTAVVNVLDESDGTCVVMMSRDSVDVVLGTYDNRVTAASVAAEVRAALAEAHLTGWVKGTTDLIKGRM